MLLINATYVASVTATGEGSTAGAYTAADTIAMYLFDGSKLYKLTVHDGENGYYNEYKPAYGTVVKYDVTSSSGDSVTTTTTFKTWTAGTPSWQ